MHAIRFDDVTLWRRTQEELTYDLKRLLFRLLERRYRRPSRRKTIDGLSFTIKPGEKIGVIGANGSGKSTMLKLACGILNPTGGGINVHGRIAALIELGAGFDAELTVAENVLYYGVLLGFTRAQMRARMASILDFAELHGYANAPLKSLSSGMSARLSFAIATDIRPEILLVDEVFAVGDEAFRVKSAERMSRFWDEHSTIVIVSHDLPFIAKNCERAMWLDQGALRAVGPADEIVARYLEFVASHGVSRRLRDGVPVSTRTAHGHIDKIDLVATRLTLNGWTLLPDDMRRGDHVGIFIDGAFFANAHYGTPRPDVGAWHRDFPDAFASGFSADLDISVLTPGPHRVDCALFNSGGGLYHLLDESRTIALALNSAAPVTSPL